MSTVTVVPTVDTASTPPRVLLDVTDTGSPQVWQATVMRLDPDGELRPVRTTDGNPLTLTTSGSNRIGSLYDYEAPFGAPVTYSTVESPAEVSAEVTIDESRVWLIHPGVPSLSQPVSVAMFGSRSFPVARGVHRPMGRKHAVVQTDGRRKASEGVIQLRVETLDELDALEALTSDASVLLLNVPASLNWGVPTSYVSVGDIEEERLVDYAAEPMRYYNLPYITVDRPEGGSQAERTYADLLEFSTYAELAAAYDSYTALLAGP